MEPSSFQYFIDVFATANKEKKITLLERLAQQKNEKLLQFLVGCLADEHWVVRKAAAQHITEYGEEAATILSGALNSYNADIQHWALNLLSKLGQKGMPAILRSMKNTNDEIRHFACNALGKNRNSNGVTALLKALGDPKWRVRKAASDALIQYGEAVIAPLQQVLKMTDDEDIKFWTIKTLGRLGPKAQKFLFDALRSGDKNSRYTIAAALGESGDQRVIKVLIESLADPDWTIRKSATMALAEVGENAVGMMLEYLHGPNEEIRDGCLRALVKTGNEGLKRLFDEIIRMDDNHRYLVRKSLVKIGARVVEPLIRLFKLDQPEVISFAASALGEIGNPRAVPVLITGLSHDDWNVRRTCAYALSEIGERGVDKIAEALQSNNDDVRYWGTRILESIGEPGVPYLMKALKDPNRDIRFFAARALAHSYDPNVARGLINCLSDEVWSIRKIAADSICALENLELDEILRSIASDNQDIKHWTRIIIKRVGHKYLDHIIEAIRKGDAELRLYACQAAGLIDSPELIEPLIAALRDDSEWVRTYAAISLGKTGDKRSIIPLIRSFSDRNADVHRSIVNSFEKLGDQVYHELVKCSESPDSQLRSNSAIALGEMRDERGLDSIILLAEDSDEKVRSAAAEALGYFPGVKARAILANLLGDKELKVRLAAIKSLGRMDSREEALLLMSHLTKAKDERELRTVKRALIEMSELNPDLFIDLFKHEQSAIKTMAMESLAGAGLAVITRLHQLIAEGEDETIVFWCKKTLKRIKEPRETSVYGRNG